MRRSLVLPFVAAAALAVRLAQADDPKTYTLPTREAWKAGDVASRHEEDRQGLHQIVSTPDGKVAQDMTNETVITYDGVLKCLEVDDRGDYTSALLWLRTWTRTSGGATDDSLTGKHVQLSSAGGTRSVKVVTPGAEPSQAALQWLDKEFGKGAANREKSGEIMVPKKPVAVGDSWEIDVDALTKTFGEGPMSFDAAKSSAKGTLEGVDGDTAKVAVAMDLQAGGMDTPNGKFDWKEGGRMVIHAGGDKALTATNHTERGRMEGTLKGVLVNAGGVTVTFELTLANRSETKTGGEMPDVPAEGAPGK